MVASQVNETFALVSIDQAGPSCKDELDRVANVLSIAISISN